MSTPASLGTYVSEADFASLPETMRRVELLDGELIMPPSPTPRHQEVLLRLAVALRAWSAHHTPATAMIAPTDVRFGPDRILQPDAFVLLEGLRDPDAVPLLQVPELVVEVLSQKRSYDRFAKRLVYSEAGVLEYWIVDPQLRHVEVWRGDEARVVEDVLTTPLLDGFTLEVQGLFPS